MSDIPAQMTAIGIKEAGGPEMLEPQQRPVPTPGAGEILVKVARRRRQPAGRDAAQGPLSAAARRAGYSRASKSAATSLRSAQGATRWKIGDQRHGAGDRRRLCRVLRGA